MPKSFQPPFLHWSFIVGGGGTQPSTVKVAVAGVPNPGLLTVFVNVPHFVGVATMVSVKGAVVV
jgi:hypothetical protein